MSFAIRNREAIQRPGGSAGPSGIGGKALVGVKEQWLAGRNIVGKIHSRIGRPAPQLERLAIVSRVVMHRLDHRTVRANQPLRGAQRVFQSDLAPFRITRFPARPPQDLQVHHGVDDRVISVGLPGRN